MSNLTEIRRAAVRLFARHGYAGTGIRELAKEVGINSATLYHYAGAKEEILVDVMTACLDALLSGGRRALAPSADPAVRLARLVRMHVAMEAVNPLTARVTDGEIRSLGEANGARIMAMRDDYESMFHQVLERGARTGAFSITDVTVTRLALIEMCNGVANWYRPDGRLSVADIQDRFAELAGTLTGSRRVAAEECGTDLGVVPLESEPVPVARSASREAAL